MPIEQAITEIALQPRTANESLYRALAESLAAQGMGFAILAYDQTDRISLHTVYGTDGTSYFGASSLQNENDGFEAEIELLEGWWDEFMESRGIRNMNIELMDDYKKDKDPEMRRLLYDWQKELTARKEETYARVNNKFFAAKQQRDKLRLSVEDQLKVKREEMNEIVRANREEAKKYTPENRVKDLKAYSKAKRNLADATNEGDKDEEIALKAEIKLLEQRLGVKAPHVLTGEESSGAAPGEEGKASSGAEEQRRNLLKDKGYNDEQIDAMMNEFKKRANA